MNKLLATLVCGLLAASAQAQTQTQAQARPQPREQAGSSANTAPIGQAVSGHNATAAGVSGTGLHTDGSATTGSAHGAIGQQAAGINSAGQVTGKSSAVVGVAPGKADKVNAQATNTTAPNSKAEDAVATGGRGKAGTKAEHEIRKSNMSKVAEPSKKTQRKPAKRAAGGESENR